MKEKIFFNSLLVSVLVLLFCAAIFFGVMSEQLKESIYSELKIEAAYAAAGIESSGGDFFDNLSTERRVTLVDAEGNVLYDNRGDAGSMDNHLDRSEISQALKNGNGRSMHYSGTTLEPTLYYACLLSDGTVLRISAPYNSLVSRLLDVLAPLIAPLLFILLLCALIASRLSHQITAPINSIDLSEPGNTHLYPELEPLVSRIREQNRTIRSQMDELGRKQREFAAITENMSEGLLLLDNKSGVLFANRFALSSLGLGEEIKSLSRARCPAEVCDIVDTALTGEHVEKVISSDERATQYICSPVVSNGHVSGAALLILDITEREKRDELRREFSANVSHELKTPLTSISGFAELMKEGLVPPEKMQEFSQDIYTESRRMISLVEDIMRLSSLEEGGVERETESVELRSVACEVMESLLPFAEKNNVSILVDGGEGYVSGNRRVLREMIYNLCENAIKYNKPGGSVTVTVSGGQGCSCISVSDTGIGIAQRHQGRIFERFYRVDKSHSRATGGTGLGLSIVRHGAAFHGAEIKLESEEGKGSRFTVIFPDKGEEK